MIFGKNHIIYWIAPSLWNFIHHVIEIIGIDFPILKTSKNGVYMF